MGSASLAAGVSRRTGFNWLTHFKAEGLAGPADRSPRPKRCPGALTFQEQGQLEALRRQRWPLWRIAAQAGRGIAPVSRCTQRLGLSRLKSLEPPVPVVRYERAAAGELLHLDTREKTSALDPSVTLQLLDTPRRRCLDPRSCSVPRLGNRPMS